MPSYKIGDVASLFPAPAANKSTKVKSKKSPTIKAKKSATAAFPESAPLKKTGSDLQSLFNDHNRKNKKFALMRQKGEKKVERSPAGKIRNKRKDRSDDSVDGNKTQAKKIKTDKTENTSAFMRSKKQKTKQVKYKDEENSDFTKELFCVNNSPDSDTSSEDDQTRRNTLIIRDRPKKELNDESSDSSFDYEKHVIFDEVGGMIDITNNESKTVVRGVDKNIIQRQQREKSTKNASKEKNHEPTSEDLPFTVFVGNLPMAADDKMLRDVFKPAGLIKSIRLRGAIPVKQSMPKKVAEIKNKFHESMQSRKAYVVFKHIDSVKKALLSNGTLLHNHHIIVDRATEKGQKKLYDSNFSVFIGNLPFVVDEETIWTKFEACGEIKAVRVIRDSTTGAGKGFGYVEFKTPAGRKKALGMNIEIQDRKIRIQPLKDNTQKNTTKLSVNKIRKNLAIKRSGELGKKKSIKKLLKKEKKLHQNRKVARILTKKGKK